MPFQLVYQPTPQVSSMAPPSAGVLFSDDFEGVFFEGAQGWSKLEVPVAGGATISKDATKVYQGSGSLKIQTRPAGAAGDTVQAYHSLMTRPSPVVRLMCVHFMQDNVTSPSAIEFELYWFDGSYLNDAKVQYLTATDKWQYWTSAGAWADVPNGGQGLYELAWHELMLEVDFVNFRYRVLQSDGRSMSLVGLGIQRVLNAAGPYFAAAVKITSADANQPSSLFDNVKVVDIR